MSNLEIKKSGKIEYLSFVKYITFMQKSFVIKKHIGKNTGKLAKNDYLLKHINELTEEEFEFRKQFLKDMQKIVSYNENLPETVEKKSILIDNLLDAKNNKDSIDIAFAKKFIYNSNNIEGSKIPEEEVEKIIETNTSRYGDINEIKEVNNSIAAHDYLNTKFRFNLGSIKRLYHILTKNLLREKGGPYPKGFKKVNNVINEQNTTPHEKVEEELEKLLDWYKKNKKNEHPLILAFTFHKRYEKIHPFLDGNGRTGRMLMNKILTSGKYNPIIIFKENKTAYYNALASDKEKKYYQFMLEQTNKSYDFILKKIDNY